MVHGLHGHLEYLSQQILPDTADAEHLDRWATIWGLARLAAVPATGTTRFTGTDGTQIPAGTTLQRADGEQFTTDALGTISGGLADVEVTAVTAGADGNTIVGIEISLTTPISGIDSVTTVQDDGSGGGLTAGTDQETDAGLRARLLLRIQQPPQGGAIADYDAWARLVNGVTRVFVKPIWAGPGSVIVWFVRDNDSDIFPDAGEIADVDAILQARRPVTANLTTSAPTPKTLDPDITLTPNTAPVQAAINAAITDLLVREALVEGTLLISHLREVISNAVGEVDHVLNSPTADVVSGSGELLVLGTPVYS
jgi:uncharacterized phage protein gp47/JayE